MTGDNRSQRGKTMIKTLICALTLALATPVTADSISQTDTRPLPRSTTVANYTDAQMSTGRFADCLDSNGFEYWQRKPYPTGYLDAYWRCFRDFQTVVAPERIEVHWYCWVNGEVVNMDRCQPPPG